MQLQALAIKPFVILFLLVAIGPIIAALAIQRQAGTINHVVFWSIAAIAIVTFGAVGLSMLNRKVELESGQLVVKSTFYSTKIAITEISDVRSVVAGSSDDVVGMRVNGVGLPGFRSGWFNSKLGGRLFVDRTSGDFLLISVSGKPALALEFADAGAARRALIAANHQGE